jgi:hypothetical protein
MPDQIIDAVMARSIHAEAVRGGGVDDYARSDRLSWPLPRGLAIPERGLCVEQN